MQFTLCSTPKNDDPFADGSESTIIEFTFDGGELQFDGIDVYDGQMTLHMSGSNTTMVMGVQGEGDVTFRLVLDIDRASCERLRKAFDLEDGQG